MLPIDGLSMTTASPSADITGTIQGKFTSRCDTDFTTETDVANGSPAWARISDTVVRAEPRQRSHRSLSSVGRRAEESGAIARAGVPSSARSVDYTSPSRLTSHEAP